MIIPHFNEDKLRQYATQKSLDRGRIYYQDRAVISICQRGNCIHAEVGSSEDQSYQVSLEFDSKKGITTADCTCPYDFEGWCKHQVAVGLTCVHKPEIIQQLPTLTEQLNLLDYEGIKVLVEKLLENRPELWSEVDRFVDRATNLTKKQTITPKQPRPQTTINIEPYRRQVQDLIREAVQYWEDDMGEENPFDNDLPDILAGVQALIDNDENEGALAALTVITETIAKDWYELDEYGVDSYGMMQELDPIWATTILSNELPIEEAIDLQVKLDNWQDVWDGNFELSTMALVQGWDDLFVEAALQGKSANIWEGERPTGADQLAQIRLEILDREQRYSEYLNLANAEEQIQEYLMMLIRLDRIPEVMAAADRLTKTKEAFTVAKALKECELLNEALSIAQIGLSLRMQESTHLFSASGDYELADWTSDLALDLNNSEAALTARIIAVKIQPSLQGYLQVETLAAENWLAFRAEILSHLQVINSWSWRVQDGAVQIFLHEEMIDDAIALVNSSSVVAKLTQQVMDEAIALRPDWVIAKALSYAEDIMNGGKSASYSDAVSCLQRARSAYLKSGRAAEWQKYYQGLVVTHGRKRKLISLMQSARLS
jgi:uncharacterized Zn finger protein